MEHKIELFYTGGGITLAEAEMDGDQYAVVSTEAPGFLTVYKKGDDETPYLPEDMVFSLAENELDEEFKSLYKEMLDELKKA